METKKNKTNKNKIVAARLFLQIITEQNFKYEFFNMPILFIFNFLAGCFCCKQQCNPFILLLILVAYSKKISETFAEVCLF